MSATECLGDNKGRSKDPRALHCMGRTTLPFPEVEPSMDKRPYVFGRLRFTLVLGFIPSLLVPPPCFRVPVTSTWRVSIID